MTVSSPEFDLIFGRIDAKEERITKLDRKIARKELRIAGMLPMTVSKLQSVLKLRLQASKLRKMLLLQALRPSMLCFLKMKSLLNLRFFGDEVDW